MNPHRFNNSVASQHPVTDCISGTTLFVVAFIAFFCSLQVAEGTTLPASSSLYRTSPNSTSMSDLANLSLSRDLYNEGQEAYNNGDFTHAVRVWRMLAEWDHAPSQFHLATMYLKGLGVDHNTEKALAWYRKAATRGHVEAQYNMGVVYAKGIGTKSDIEEAIVWWRRAALKGNTDAQYNLGLLYSEGRGVNADPVVAARWWRKAARQGDPAAQFNLGVMYARGHGVHKNFNKAIHWWEASARQGFNQAIKVLKVINKETYTTGKSTN